MIVKVLDARGAGTTGAVAEGISYAAANGARIINLSLGGPTRDPRLVEAVRAAEAANVLLVCSAGNLGQNVDQKPSYPVSLAARNLLGVAATEPARGRDLGDFSNYGRNTIGLAAPGVDVLSSANDGGWELKSGTSMAAPHATGVAALMAAMRPDMSAAELRAELLQSASRASLPIGAGYLDALTSVVNTASAAGFRLGQPPLVRVLSAQRKGAQTVAQIAALGETQGDRPLPDQPRRPPRRRAGQARLAVHGPAARPRGPQAARRRARLAASARSRARPAPCAASRRASAACAAAPASAPGR